MQLSPHQIIQLLERSKQNLFVLTGAVTVLVNHSKHLLWQNARKSGYEEKTRIIIQNIDGLDALKQTINTPSLFCEKSWIDCSIETNKLGKKGYETLQACATALGPNHMMCVHFPLVEHQHKKQKWFQKITKDAVHIDCKEPSGKDVIQWIKLFCQDNHLDLTQDQITMLIAYTEGNLSACAQEIIKLSLIANKQTISTDMMELALSDSSQHTLFQLIDHALLGNTTKMFPVLHRLKQQSMAPILILWGIVRELRLLITIKAKLIQKHAWTTVMQQHRIWSSRQAILKTALAKHSVHDLLSLLQKAADLEQVIKGLQPGNAWNQFDTLFLQLARSKDPEIKS